MLNNSTSSHGSQSWGAVLTLALATFLVVTTEMLPVGLLTPIAEQFSISISLSGLLMTLPAIIAAISSPLIVLFTHKVDRKKLLIFGALLLVVCNSLAAFTPCFELLLISRIFVGICIGIIWAIAGGIAPRLVAPSHISLATSLIFGGVAAASVIGIPLGIFIGDWLNWRSAFILITALSIVLLLLMKVFLPSLTSDSKNLSINVFATQIKRPVILVGLAITLLLVSGHFMAFTYIRPLLISHLNASGEQISLLLFFYGIAGIFGNFIFGLSAGKKLNFSLIVIMLLITICLILFVAFPLSMLSGGIIIIIWGAAYGGVSVTLMTWMITHSNRHIEITSALYIAFFNGGIALGSALGSIVVLLNGLNINLIVSTLLFIAAMLILTIYFSKNPTHSKSCR
ncbi:MFS transporter [Providencia sp.]